MVGDGLKTQICKKVRKFSPGIGILPDILAYAPVLELDFYARMVKAISGGDI